MLKSEKIEAEIHRSREVLLTQLGALGYNSDVHTGASAREVAAMIASNQLDMLLKRGGAVSADSSGSGSGDLVKSNTAANSATAVAADADLDPALLPVDAIAATTDKIYVRYALLRTVRPNVLNELVDELFGDEQTLTKRDTLIVVMKEPVNDTLTTAIVNLWERDGIFVIVHCLPRLQYNLLEHEIVPPHFVMTDAGRQAGVRQVPRRAHGHAQHFQV